MSAKYKRIKQTDESLPAPLRWLTRAFSSITLSVILLTLIALYGTLGSVPLAMLAKAVMIAVVGGSVLLIVGVLLWWALWRKRWIQHRGVRALVSLGALAGGVTAAIPICGDALAWLTAQPWMAEHRATVVYRLRALEMTELEFYSWWPMQLLLVLFVCNMVWATIRRIEFSIPRLGVLTVHAGIVTMAVGTMFYGRYKMEAQMFLPRVDTASPAAVFSRYAYDRNDPAVYVSVNGQMPLVIPLAGRLPRYNDYELGELNIALHEAPGFVQQLGPNLRMTIPGFYAYAERAEEIRDMSEVVRGAAAEFDKVENPQERAALQDLLASRYGPAVRVAMGDVNHPSASDGGVWLLGLLPNRRVVSLPTAEVELLATIDPARERDLLEPVAGPHTLVVEVPTGEGDETYRNVYAIEQGATIEVGDTGYTLQVEQLGPYEIGFVTEGYRGAEDTRALVKVTGPEKAFTRVVLHRYPERSQDFVPSDKPGVGPMGERQDPDPAVRLTYLDDSKLQYRLVPASSPSAADTQSSDAASVQGTGMRLLMRGGSLPAAIMQVVQPKLKLPEADHTGHNHGPDETHAQPPSWLHIVEHYDYAMPMPTVRALPKSDRDPKTEGTYENAFMPVRLELLEDGQPEKVTGDQTVWLPWGPFPREGLGQELEVPGIGTVQLMFSRSRYTLPFTVSLQAFDVEMYPSSDQPRDFIATLQVDAIGEDGKTTSPRIFKASMNNPVSYHPPNAALGMGTIKLSQVQWDPGDPQMPAGLKAQTDEAGRYVNKHRFTVIGVSNNVGIQIIALGAIMVGAGIPWAFWVKPWMLRRRARQAVERQLAQRQATANEATRLESDNVMHDSPQGTVPVKTRPLTTVGLILLMTVLTVVMSTGPAMAQARQDIAGNSDQTSAMSGEQAGLTSSQGVAATASMRDAMTRAEHQAFAEQVDLTALRKVSVFDGERVKLLDTLAREHMVRVTGRGAYRDVAGHDEHLPAGDRDQYVYDPVFTYLDLVFGGPDPENEASRLTGYYADKPVVYVEVLPLRRELVSHLPAEEQEYWLRQARLSPLLLAQPAPQSILRSDDGDVLLSQARNKLFVAYAEYVRAGERLALVSPAEAQGDWCRLEAHEHTDKPGVPMYANPAAAVGAQQAWADLETAWLAGDAQGVNASANALAELLPQINPQTYPSETRRSLEGVYNKAGRYAAGWMLHAAAAVLLLLAVTTGRRTLLIAGGALLGLGFLVQVAGVMTRAVISGRWPIHNQYESFMAIAMFAVAVGGVMMVVRRMPVFGLGAAVLGAGTLMFAHFLPAAFPTKAVGNDMPILATSSILFVHVNIVLFSYALIALAFTLSLTYLGVHYLGLAGRRDRRTAGKPEKPPKSVKPLAFGAGGSGSGGALAMAGGGVASSGEVARVRHGKASETQVAPAVAGLVGDTDRKVGAKALLHDLDTAQLVVMQLAFWLLGVGILLGAYWADHAWGRWWAWDPKETWALITWIVYLIAIHTRFSVKRRGLVTAWLGVTGFFVMLWCYWGVNLFLAGLHSYA